MESIRASLEDMQSIDIRTVDPATLRDIQDVAIDRDLPKEERIRSYLRQIGNPYCYRVPPIKMLMEKALDRAERL